MTCTVAGMGRGMLAGALHSHSMVREPPIPFYPARGAGSSSHLLSHHSLPKKNGRQLPSARGPPGTPPPPPCPPHCLQVALPPHTQTLPTCTPRNAPTQSPGPTTAADHTRNFGRLHHGGASESARSHCTPGCPEGAETQPHRSWRHTRDLESPHGLWLSHETPTPCLAHLSWARSGTWSPCTALSALADCLWLRTQP